MWRAGIAALLLFGCQALAEETALVSMFDTWRWFKGRTEPSSPPEAWRLEEFPDSTWFENAAGFAFDLWSAEATYIAETNRNYMSLYFRRKFVLTDPESVKWLVLRVDYDGGFVAHLNGTEAIRRGLPGEPGATVPCDTPAEQHGRGYPEEFDLSASAHLLKEGTNVLAIQWHFSIPWYTTMTFAPELLANFTRGPYLQNTSTTRQQIIWLTPVDSDTLVEFGATPDLGMRYADTNPVKTHVTVLTDLLPDTLYHYRVSSSDGTNTVVSPTSAFRTLKNSGPVSFAVVADIGQGSLGQFRLSRLMEKTQPDLVVVNGDVVYPWFSQGQADLHFFSVYRRLMRSTPFYITAGNHDVWITDKFYYSSLYMPTNSVSPADHLASGTNPESYYSFDHGDAHFVAVFLPILYQLYTPTNGSPQMRWLEADLAASTKPWKFMFLHHSLFTSGYHRFNDYNSNSLNDNAEVAAALLPLARRYGVQVIFTAHDHTYERFNPVQGVQILLTGGGGGVLYQLKEMDPHTSQFYSKYNFIRADLRADSLYLEALDDKGNRFDWMHLTRVLPDLGPQPAVRNSPTVEAGVNDGDGNLRGQVFDMAGPPIPTIPGDCANLGRVFVNANETTLYIGLEQAMIYASNCIYLFIEAPRVPGVRTLAGLGNNLLDPDGQGADGLDMLENLSFTNFNPGIGFILGDEFADGQFRSFMRTNYIELLVGGYATVTLVTSPEFNVGQGAFYLDKSFNDLPGVSIQQYNRSPQLDPVLPEQNANFIELAIPLSTLGLSAGDRFKIGAVVAGDLLSTNAPSSGRYIDRAFLGRGLTRLAGNAAALEGVEIVLPPPPDHDLDGLSDAQEAALGTDPNNPDSDSDGLPDGWEVANGLNPLNSQADDGPDGDPDRDNASNYAEFVAGTRPNDSSSVLRIELSLQAGQVHLEWDAVAGKTYYLQAADSPAHAFQDLTPPGPMTATATGPMSWQAPFGAADNARYFRLRVVP